MSHGLIALVAALLLASPAGTQEFRVRPALLTADGDALPGIRFTIAGDRGDLFIRTVLPGEWTWGARIDAPLVWDADRNPETLRAALGGGLQLSLFRAATPPGPVPSPDDPPPLSFGYLALDLRFAGEAPQSFDHRDASVGVSLAYEHDQYHRLWFLPELRIGYDAVFCFDCDPTGTSTETSHSRLDTEIGWNLPLDRGWVPSPLRPVWIRLRGRAFETRGLHEDIALVRNLDGRWGSAELAYRIDRDSWLHEIFVNWREGDLPQRLDSNRAWKLGASVFF